MSVIIEHAINDMIIQIFSSEDIYFLEFYKPDINIRLQVYSTKYNTVYDYLTLINNNIQLIENMNYRELRVWFVENLNIT
jgi:hypothetical protein